MSTPPRLFVAIVPAPWGPIHVATSNRGLLAMEHLSTEEEVQAGLERRFGRPTVEWSGRSEMLDRATTALDAFIAGDLGAFHDLPLDLDDRSPFDRTVFEAVRSIPPGATASYGEVARMIGRPGAARAVGGAIGRCPIGLAIPCHRVIAGDGTLGGYGGGAWGGREAGLALKRELLAREGVTIGSTRA